MAMVDLSSSRVKQTIIIVGVAVLIVAGAIDRLSSARRRASHYVGESWRRLERHEARNARHAEIAYLAGRLGRHPRPA